VRGVWGDGGNVPSEAGARGEVPRSTFPQTVTAQAFGACKQTSRASNDNTIINRLITGLGLFNYRYQKVFNCLFKYETIGGLSPAPPLLEGRYAVPPNPPHTSVICGAVMVRSGTWVWLVGCLDGWGDRTPPPHKIQSAILLLRSPLSLHSTLKKCNWVNLTRLMPPVPPGVLAKGPLSLQPTN
jgi:hypothetical protein